MSHWMVSYRNFSIESVRLRETLLTLGNGYFATRGAHEDYRSAIHYPATYLGGVFNRAVSKVAGQTLVNEDLVNMPNWLPITFKVAGEDWFDIQKVELLCYCEMLHLKKGIMKRSLKFRDNKGRIFIINSMRFVSQHNPHAAGLRYSIICENWQGKIIIRSSINGDSQNQGVPRYKDLNQHHLEIIQKGAFDKKYLYLQARTNQSHIEVSEVIKTEIYRKNSKLDLDEYIYEEEKNIHQEFEVNIIPYEKINVIKLLSIYNSKDYAIAENLYEAKKFIKSGESFSSLLKMHLLVWKQLWHQSDIEIDSIKNEQQLIRLHLFHSLQSLSKHSIKSDYGVPARGLHGEAYRGHVFWDEIFILPFFFYHFPEVARALLMYRYNRLPAARQLAKANGYKGAMFPWQSASNGEEETQEFHLNPQSSSWGPDYSRYQRHVNLAIVYNIWNYYQITGDLRFLSEYGAEMILEIAKFIASMTSFNISKNRYEINGVMGPDEYHERYFWDSQPGVNNNTYTNVMAIWVLEKALELRNILSKKQMHFLFEMLHISTHELNLWQSIIHQMFIPFHECILSQFEGYERLKEFDWNLYKEKYSHFERLDRILKAEGQEPDQFQIAKQPDTLMLFYLLEDHEIKRIIHRLGYPYDEAIRNYTIQYYLQRTSHGSTLSKMVFASLLFDRQPDRAASLFHEALISDIHDTQGGTTQEGIHLGVMVGTTSILIKDFCGVKIKQAFLALDPQLPHWIERVKFKIEFQNNLYEIEIFPDVCYLQLCEKYNHNSQIFIQNELISLHLDKPIYISYRKKAMATNEEKIDAI